MRPSSDWNSMSSSSSSRRRASAERTSCAPSSAWADDLGLEPREDRLADVWPERAGVGPARAASSPAVASAWAVTRAAASGSRRVRAPRAGNGRGPPAAARPCVRRGPASRPAPLRWRATAYCRVPRSGWRRPPGWRRRRTRRRAAPRCRGATRAAAIAVRGATRCVGRRRNRAQDGRNCPSAMQRPVTPKPGMLNGPRDRAMCAVGQIES